MYKNGLLLAELVWHYRKPELLLDQLAVLRRLLFFPDLFPELMLDIIGGAPPIICIGMPWPIGTRYWPYMGLPAAGIID